MKHIVLLIISLTLFGESLLPLPQHIEGLDAKKVALGKALFEDTLLSGDNTVSCASCHNLKEGGDDNLQFSFGVNGARGNMNAPTVYNAVYNFRQFWDGRAKDLQEQAAGPIENPVEMANSFEDLIKTLNKTHYREEFMRIYKEGISKKSITDAIAEFEKTLTTPNAPFDRYLRGDTNALTQKQKVGYELFKSKGCVSCHQGINIGGNMYAKFGVMEDTKSTSKGRFDVTHRQRDMYYFKVPSLRNVAQTAPYFHDGRFSSLAEAVKFMDEVQLAKKTSVDEIDAMVAFLKSLSGELPSSVK